MHAFCEREVLLVVIAGVDQMLRRAHLAMRQSTQVDVRGYASLQICASRHTDRLVSHLVTFRIFTEAFDGVLFVHHFLFRRCTSISAGLVRTTMLRQIVRSRESLAAQSAYVRSLLSVSTHVAFKML